MWQFNSLCSQLQRNSYFFVSSVCFLSNFFVREVCFAKKNKIKITPWNISLLQRFYKCIWFASMTIPDFWICILWKIYINTPFHGVFLALKSIIGFAESKEWSIHGAEITKRLLKIIFFICSMFFHVFFLLFVLVLRNCEHKKWTYYVPSFFLLVCSFLDAKRCFFV